MPGFLVTGDDGRFEQWLPENVDLEAAAVGLAWQLAAAEGLKVVHVFHGGQERWFARVELP